MSETKGVSARAYKAAGLVKLCSGCEMAGRMCDDCRDYAPARYSIAAALDAFADSEVQISKTKRKVL
jgi:hypothetical protein